MQESRNGRLWQWAVAALVTTTLLIGACGREAAVGPDSPELPAAPTIPPQFRGAAFTVDISTKSRAIRVTAPGQSIGGSGSVGTGIAGRLGGGGRLVDAGGAAFSLLGGDAVELIATNFVAGPLGAKVPGKVQVTFDVQINNRLNGVNLIKPTFPTPPPSAVGLLMFPFEIAVTTSTGGVANGSNGSEVVVTTARSGAVEPSDDWDGNGSPGSGAPWNFFGDTPCSATSSTCFRYEEYGVVPSLSGSATRKIGFLLDPAVGDFRVQILVAADLSVAQPSSTGSVTGVVTSPELGNISGAIVNVSGGFSGSTRVDGTYSIAGVSAGSHTVTVTNLPNGCTAPAAQNITATAGGTATANFTVTCQALSGAVQGTISSSLGGPLAGVTVTLTPAGGSALPSVQTGTTGGYAFASVPVGTGGGSIALTNLPSNCTDPGAVGYSGLTSGGLLTLNVTVTCGGSAQTGTVAGTVTSSQGGTLSGVSVVVTPTGGPALGAVLTGAAGTYSRTNVPASPGTGTVAVSGVPANCAAPLPAAYTGVTAGGTVTVDITVTCTAPAQSGTLSGSITSSQGGAALSGVSVIVTPTGGAALPAVSTNATGAYTRNSVPVPPSDGTIALSGLPANCTAPAPTPYTGLTANGTVTVDITVTCAPPPTDGTITGTVFSSPSSAVLPGVTLEITPTGGSALGAVTSNASGAYTRTGIPVPPSTGTIVVTAVPTGCTIPAPTAYSGLTAGGRRTVDITVNCQAAPQFGTVAGTVTSSQGGAPLTNVSVVVTPTGGSAQPPVTTNASGAYSRSNVPVPPSGGTIALSGLPANCTTPAPTPYAGLGANGTVTVNITVTCSASVTYPFTGTWGPITSGGPTGRQVTLTLAIDMGPAPGRPDVNGSAQDELVSMQYSLLYSGSLLSYDSKTGLDPNLTLIIAGSPSAGQTNVIQTSATGATSKGAINLLRITYNIPAGAAGTVTPTVTFVEVLAGLFASPIDVKANVVPNLPSLVIP